MVQHREEENINSVGIFTSWVSSSRFVPPSPSSLRLHLRLRQSLLLGLLTLAVGQKHLATKVGGPAHHRSHPRGPPPVSSLVLCRPPERWGNHGNHVSAFSSFVTTGFRGSQKPTHEDPHRRRRRPPRHPRVFLAAEPTQEGAGQLSPTMDPQHRHRPSYSTLLVPHVKPPLLYITIGPPCAGKTTWLWNRRRHPPQSPPPATNVNFNANRDDSAITFVDVALDDQPGVYQPLHPNFFLSGGDGTLSKDASSAAPHTAHAAERRQRRQTRIFGKTINDRIQNSDQAELCLVLKRLALQLSSNEFATAIRDLPPSLSNESNPTESRPPQPKIQSVHAGTVNPPNDPDGGIRTSSTSGSGEGGIDPTWRDRLHAAVEAVLEDVQHRHHNPTNNAPHPGHSRDDGSEVPLPPWMPSAVDLFIREAIFRSPVPGGLTGLEAAQAKLATALRSHNASSQPIEAVAWGNTNTRPREYRDALRLACETGRPVRFVVHRPADWPAELESTSSSTDDDGGGDHILHFNAEPLFDLGGDLDELLRRGVRRLLTTGRYVPAKVIEDMHRRTGDLLRRALALRATLTPAQLDSASETTSLTKWELDCLLARLADFELREDRTVAPLGRPPSFRGRRNGTERNGTQAQSRESRHHSTAGPGGPPRPWDRGGPRRQPPPMQWERDPPQGRPPPRGGPSWTPGGGSRPEQPPVRTILRRPDPSSPRGAPLTPQPGGAVHRPPPSLTGGGPPPPKRPRAPGGSGNSDDGGNGHRTGAT